MLDLLTLILQIGLILGLSRLVGWVFRRIYQPQVVGEMVAGIMLGPSLLGWLAPGVFTRLFPPDSLDILNGISQVGLLLFIFLVGLEFSKGMGGLPSWSVKLVSTFRSCLARSWQCIFTRAFRMAAHPFSILPCSWERR